MSKTKVITIANHKGGCGKSTSTSAIATAMAQKGYKILVIDGDMQQNLSQSFGMETNDEKNLDYCIRNKESIEDKILHTDYENIDIVTSHPNMAMVEVAMFGEMGREYIVREIITPVIEKGTYDFILFDTNPTLALLNINIFIASDYILVPIESSAYGIEGLGVLTKFYGQMKKWNNKLEIAGVFLTNVDKRLNIVKEAQSVVTEVFGDKLFKTEIFTDANVKKAQWERIPLLEYAPNSRASLNYRDLAEEVLKVVNKQE